MLTYIFGDTVQTIEVVAIPEPYEPLDYYGILYRGNNNSYSAYSTSNITNISW
jgi:hypothetical protein